MMACIQYILSKHTAAEEKSVELTSDYTYDMQMQNGLGVDMREVA